jgi:hypothetical protein
VPQVWRERREWLWEAPAGLDSADSGPPETRAALTVFDDAAEARSTGGRPSMTAFVLAAVAAFA